MLNTLFCISAMIFSISTIVGLAIELIKIKKFNINYGVALVFLLLAVQTLFVAIKLLTLV